MEKEEMKSSPRKRFLSQQQANGDEVDRKIGRSNAEHEEVIFSFY
jgi:hypothetical protein